MEEYSLQRRDQSLTGRDILNTTNLYRRIFVCATDFIYEFQKQPIVVATLKDETMLIEKCSTQTGKYGNLITENSWC